MEIFLKYLPILPAMVAAYMGARAVISDIRAIKSAAIETGRTPFWRRQIAVIVALVILAWVPFLISLFVAVPTASLDIIPQAAAPIQKELDSKTQELGRVDEFDQA
jgi:hypothetical protein